MGKNISLFSGYNQTENRTTNYCLLILKLLYQENPKFLSDFFSVLLENESIGDLVGVKFAQQEKKKLSIPDGLIFQSAFTIYIETKNFDWFYDSQLENHISSLSKENEGTRIMLAISKFESNDYKKFENIISLCKNKYKGKIIFKALSFEDYYSALNINGLPKNIIDLVEEFREYLNEEYLLPAWKNWLDVVNCAGIPEEVLEGNVYMCPASGGSYSHGRCQYFGMYRNKTVEKIATIDAVVDIEGEGEDEINIKWKNTEIKDSEIISLSKEKLSRFRPDDFPTRVFLLGKLYDTNFKKDTSGGMMGSKIYFNIASVNPIDAKDLAEKLENRNWTEFP